MLDMTTKKIIEDSQKAGWVLEPDAKAVMQAIGLDVPEGISTASVQDAEAFLTRIKGPVVVKAVSEKILHKTEHQAVVVGIDSAARLEREMKRLLALPGCSRVLVEETVSGIEVIIGAKNDYQFGPVVVLGLGGTGVEIYNDTAIRLAPLKPGDVTSMVGSLRAGKLLSGYRGGRGIAMAQLEQTLVRFSQLMMELQNDAASIDLNPVMCTAERCVVADARIILNTFRAQ